MTKKQTKLTLFSSTVKQVGNETVIPSPRPCFHFKSHVYAYFQVCRGTPKCPRLAGYPKFTGRLRSSEDQGSPGQIEATSGRHVAPLAAVTTHARDSHLLPQEPGHQQITAQMSAQRLEPLAFSGSRLESALGREPRSQQYPAPLTFSYLNTYFNKSKKYQMRRDILLVIVIGICQVLGPILLSKTAIKNSRSEVPSFLCENSRFFEKIN